MYKQLHFSLTTAIELFSETLHLDFFYLYVKNINSLIIF